MTTLQNAQYARRRESCRKNYYWPGCEADSAHAAVAFWANGTRSLIYNCASL
jgi:hypothetical protein